MEAAFEQQIQVEASPSPSKGKKSAKKTTTVTKTKMNTTVTMSANQIANEYGLTPDQVEIESLKAKLAAAEQRVLVTESVEAENAMLRTQLTRCEEIRKQQIVQIDEVHKANMALQNENEELKQENTELRVEIENWRKESIMASDYIASLEEKCYRANKTSLDLL